KGEMADEETYREVVKVMTTLNKYAKDAIVKVGVNGCTDVTGFGLLGHSLEMAMRSSVTIKIDHEKIRLINNSIEYATMGIVPAGAYSNEAYIGDRVIFDRDVPIEMRDILFDPQTSGGLLVSLPKEKIESLLNNLEGIPTSFSIIGEVLEKKDHYLIVE